MDYAERSQVVARGGGDYSKSTSRYWERMEMAEYERAKAEEEVDESSKPPLSPHTPLKYTT